MIREYLEYIETVRNYSTDTVNGYRRDLSEWVRWARERGLRWSKVSQQDIDCWVSDMHQTGLAATTINRRLSALKGVMKWAFHRGMLERNASQYCQRPKIKKSLPKISDLSEIDIYLQSEHQPGIDKEAATAIAIMIETGVRISECLNIRMSDIDRETNSIRISGKGAKERTVYYGRRVNKLLEHTQTSSDKLLLSAYSQRQWRQIIEDALYPYTGHTTPHRLRHTMATSALNAGMPIEAISKLLGHTKVETTQIYAELSNKSTQRLYNQYQF